MSLLHGKNSESLLISFIYNFKWRIITDRNGFLYCNGLCAFFFILFLPFFRRRARVGRSAGRQIAPFWLARNACLKLETLLAWRRVGYLIIHVFSPPITIYSHLNFPISRIVHVYDYDVVYTALRLSLGMIEVELPYRKIYSDTLS